jgi:hypothetical protein
MLYLPSALAKHDGGSIFQTCRPSEVQRVVKEMAKSVQLSLLSCLFVEIVSPAKVLSLAFQREDIDPVYSISQLEKAKRHLQRLERKHVEDLPTVKRFLDKVVLVNGEHQYQNVVLYMTS